MNRKIAIATALCGMMAAPLMADSLELTGIVRDFKRGDKSGGHADFETAGAAGKFGHVTGMVTMALGSDGKPVFNPTRPSSNDTIKNAASFTQWFNDVVNVNSSAPLTLVLDNGRTTAGGTYTYLNNSFWPIDNQMFGNQSLNHNFHFTFELHTQFSYAPGQKFTFIGDDDVWVYVDGTRIIDLGGVHGATTASVLLFDGKAIVEKAHFATAGVVKVVGTTLASQMAANWTLLGLSGSCPITSTDKYIDLGLKDGTADVNVTFTNTSTTVKSTQSLTKVVLKFSDNTVQKFESLTTATFGTFAGSGAHAGKTLAGVWVASGTMESTGYGTYYSPAGSTNVNTLDFFFAERHTTQSNFRIDTTMQLVEVPPTTISPLYD